MPPTTAACTGVRRWGGACTSPAVAAARVPAEPEAEQDEAVAFLKTLDIRSIAQQVMRTLFQSLSMRYHFPLD